MIIGFMIFYLDAEKVHFMPAAVINSNLSHGIIAYNRKGRVQVFNFFFDPVLKTIPVIINVPP